MNIQIPDILVLGVLYAVVSGISIWLLAFHKENPTNWILYPMFGAAVLAGLVKFGLHTRRSHQRSA